ncbi:MAG: D-alanyl-D-alanine carboxypeptidase [Lachnospiraceae bacterium]|nr:D-alanyl-D-alanine carboxypeptidase [Lachnospiraceae bacterium]
MVCFLVTLLIGCGKANESSLTASFDASMEVPEAKVEQETLMASELSVFDPDVITEEFPEVYAALLADETTGEAILGEHVYDKFYPASITKIFTAYMALKYADLDDTVTVSYRASHITTWGAQLCKLEEGDQINMKNLLEAMLCYSGNDTSIAIAEHISGSVEDFCDQMNEEARKLGCVNTHLVNPHGLHEDDHYTSAYDIYLVMRELMKDERFREMDNAPKAVLHITHANGETEDREFVATNRYFNGEVEMPKNVELIGGKTGTTSQAGYCLVLGSTGKESGDLYISVILHAKNKDRLYQYMTELLANAK